LAFLWILIQTDALGNQTKVLVGSQVLSENHYTPTGDKLLTHIEYGNGGKVHYTYDSFKRTIGIRYDEAIDPRFVYAYGLNGEIGRVKDNELNREVRMEFMLDTLPHFEYRKINITRPTPLNTKEPKTCWSSGFAERAEAERALWHRRFAGPLAKAASSSTTIPTTWIIPTCPLRSAPG